MPSYDRALHALRSWLDSWAGIGHVAVETLASFQHRHTYEITTAQSVADTLAILQRERFDLILLDMVMPGIGDPMLRRQGLDLLKRIRDLGVNAPVLMMSGDWDSRREDD